MSNTGKSVVRQALADDRTFRKTSDGRWRCVCTKCDCGRPSGSDIPGADCVACWLFDCVPEDQR